MTATVIAAHWLSSLAGLCALVVIWRLYRRTRYLKELLRREKEQSFGHYNKIVMNLSEAYSKGPNPTLAELGRNIESEFELE
jgi:hypothetical protein